MKCHNCPDCSDEDHNLCSDGDTIKLQNWPKQWGLSGFPYICVSGLLGLGYFHRVSCSKCG